MDDMLRRHLVKLAKLPLCFREPAERWTGNQERERKKGDGEQRSIKILGPKCVPYHSVQTLRILLPVSFQALFLLRAALASRRRPWACLLFSWRSRGAWTGCMQRPSSLKLIHRLSLSPSLRGLFPVTESPIHAMQASRLVPAIVSSLSHSPLLLTHTHTHTCSLSEQQFPSQ